MFFAFFYTAIVFNPEDTAEICVQWEHIADSSGKPTADYLDYILTRLTVIGAAYLAMSILPEILISQYAVPFLFGTSLLIVVTVSLMPESIQSHLLAHQYEGLIKKQTEGRRS